MECCCPVCGLRSDGPCPNRWCRRADRGFSVVFAASEHAGELRAAMVRYKYGNEKSLASTFAGLMARFVASHPLWFEEFDVVTAVPAYTGPGARRRWSPVGRMVAELTARLGSGWAVEPGLVVKAAETPALAGLDWTARQRIAQGPLRRSLRVPDPSAVAGLSILVVDDVLTDGSTLREMALALRSGGATDVAGLVLGRHRWEPSPPGPG